MVLIPSLGTSCGLILVPILDDCVAEAESIGRLSFNRQERMSRRAAESKSGIGGEASIFCLSFLWFHKFNTPLIVYIRSDVHRAHVMMQKVLQSRIAAVVLEGAVSWWVSVMQQRAASFNLMLYTASIKSWISSLSVATNRLFSYHWCTNHLLDHSLSLATCALTIWASYPEHVLSADPRNNWACHREHIPYTLWFPIEWSCRVGT